MNVLILTPDAVGSTLLQRLITIHMQFQGFGRPVINLHELTNGLVKYYNPVFDQDVLGKPKTWGYFQSLNEVVDLLSSVDHYKTSRLAHYHIKNRQDSLSSQVPFYNYLNENFLIISCRRRNVFEHALSFALSKITKKLNVYSHQEKIVSFFHLYRDGVIIDPNSLIDTLEAYKSYVEWSRNYFDTAFYFNYEDHMPNIEQFIMTLPISNSATRTLGWQANLGMDFNTWNRCHYYSSDIGTVALENKQQFDQLLPLNSTRNEIEDLAAFISHYNNIADSAWPRIQSYQDFANLPDTIKQECQQNFGLVPHNSSAAIINQSLLTVPVKHQDFLDQHAAAYTQTCNQINQMVTQGIMVSAPPIKKHTLKEKRFLIQNFDQLVDTYNHWIEFNRDLGDPVDSNSVDQCIAYEDRVWGLNSAAKLINN